MCGIYGLVQAWPFDSHELCEMSRLLRHRGPDDEGLLVWNRNIPILFGGSDTPLDVLESDVPYTPESRIASNWHSSEGGVALGHRRLSILDLSARGHQPMAYRNRYWITYNGEVYNYLELRTKLSSQGYEFTSDSDTEVILAAYDRWGQDCLSRFNGMWGLAILDTKENVLFLARDRFGVKPVYLYVRDGRFAFASEIKAFSALEGWRPKANLSRLLDFLVWNITDHTPETMFEHIYQLPAGHFVRLDLSAALHGQGKIEEGAIRPMRWYSLPVFPGSEGAEADAADELRDVLEDSVRMRLRADVTVGSCLSGGLDSSAIVCLMSRQLAAQGASGVLHTFTAGSHDAEFDESAYARAVNQHAAAEGHFVTPEPSKLFEELGRLAWHQDEPFVSTSNFAQWCVFAAARQNGIVVMLDGQGADEILCGYRGFFGAYLAGLIRLGRIIRWLKELVALRREIGFEYVRSLGYTVAYLRPELLGLLGRFDNRAYSDKGWLRASYHEAYEKDPVRAAGGRANSVRAMSHAQVTATNLPMLLHWEDRNSMAFSVEARVPFMDYRVVECCLRIPDSQKLGGGISKAVLRRSMRGVVPDKILDRRDKMGFVTAEKLWLSRDLPVRFRAELAAAVEALPGIFNPNILRSFDEVVAGRRQFDHRYWRAISAGRWAQAFAVAAR